MIIRDNTKARTLRVMNNVVKPSLKCRIAIVGTAKADALKDIRYIKAKILDRR